MKHFSIGLVLVLAASAPVHGQDARAVIAAASKAMGIDRLNSITMYGSGASYTFGQSTSPYGPWTRTNISDYTRTIDFTQPALRASAETYGIQVTGDTAVQVPFNQNITPAQNTWPQQLNIWTTPWGFLKGAAANAATVRVQTLGGKKYNVVTWSPVSPKSPSGKSYRVVGYLNDQNLLEKTETWIEQIVTGDMLVETTYSVYRDNNGLKFPTLTVQKQGGWPMFELQLTIASANPPNLAQLMQAPAGRGGAGRGGGPGANPSPATAEKMADGVFRIPGVATSLAVEFTDHIVLVEAGEGDDRTEAVLAAARKAIPNKPVTYVVNTHHHFDHSSGLPAVVAEGITIITHENNRAFYEKSFTAPRTLGNDLLARKGGTVKPKFETVTGDKKVLQDSMRTLELAVIKDLPHADGMLVAYLPKEKILYQADMYFAPEVRAAAPVPPANPNSLACVTPAAAIPCGVRSLLENIQRLGINYDLVVSAHGPNPDRPVTAREVLASVGQ